MPVALRFSIIAVLCSLAVACASPPQPRDITRLVVESRTCVPRCVQWSVAIAADGRVAYSPTGDPRDEFHGRMTERPYTAVIELLLASGFFSGRTDYRPNDDVTNTTYITAWVRDAARTIALPTGSGLYSGDAARLQRYVDFALAAARGATWPERSALQKHLTNFGALSQVVLRANGCFGTCPAYTVAFRSDGCARIDIFDMPRRMKVQARAGVPFRRVTDALQAAGAGGLARHYPVRVMDAFGARLHLLYRDGFAYDSDGPDQTQWSPQFQAVVDRIDQLVLDTRWQPALPKRVYGKEG